MDRRVWDIELGCPQLLHHKLSRRVVELIDVAIIKL